MKDDYYVILGLTQEDIELTTIEFKVKVKKAYRTISKECHPDKTNGDKILEEKFKNVSEAYETLYDETKRSKYDRENRNNYNSTNNRNYRSGFRTTSYDYSDIFGGFSESGFEDFFKQYERNRANTKGDNIEVTINISINDSLNGSKQTVTYKRKKKCVCNGVKQNCYECNSSGLINVEDTLNITIPKPTINFSSFKLFGKGNSILGGTDGDLIVKIKIVESENFVINGFDLITNLNLNFHQYVLGTTIELKLPDSTTIRINIKAGTSVGSKLKVSNKGLYSEKTVRGDLILETGIRIPTDIDDDLRNVILELKKITNK